MAAINLTITIPDAQMARVRTALKAHGTYTNDQGQVIVPDNAAIIENLRLGVMRQIKQMVRAYEEAEAIKVAAASITDVDAQ